jgi:large conductance mechanosensitive channel
MSELEGYIRKGTSKAASFWKDFASFAFKGNLIDLAIAVVIGQAFGNVVNSLVKHVIMPLTEYISPRGGGYRDWKIGKAEVGLFLGDLLQFLIVALAVYVVLIKLLGTIQKVVPFAGPEEPTVKKCPYCLSEIPFKARKCAHCTADLTGAAGEPTAAP